MTNTYEHLVGLRFRHWKGSYYRVVSVSRSADDLSIHVQYAPETMTNSDGTVWDGIPWDRTTDDFFAKEPRSQDGLRFTHVPAEGMTLLGTKEPK